MKKISISSGATSGSYYTSFTDNLPSWEFLWFGGFFSCCFVVVVVIVVYERR